MAIDGIGLNLNRVAAGNAYGVGNSGGASTAPAAPVRRADGVEISAAGRELQAARAADDGLPEVREDRVAALKAAIANGSYQVDSSALTQKLLGLA